MGDDPVSRDPSEVSVAGFRIRFIETEPPRHQHPTNNRTLTPTELREVFAPLLAQVAAKIEEAAAGDPGMLFALRRKLSKELEYLERGKPMQRRAIKQRKLIEQGGLCAECGQALSGDEPELDRREAILGYTMENTRLVHHSCHRKLQREKGFA